MKLTDIKGTPTPVLKLQELVGKVIQLDFVINRMKQYGGGHSSISYEKEGVGSPDTMIMTVLGYGKKNFGDHYTEMLFFANDFHLEKLMQKGEETFTYKGDKDSLELIKKDDSTRYGGYDAYELTNLKVLN